MRFVFGSLFELAGLAAITWGIYSIFPPAGFIAGGLSLLLLAWRLP